MSTSDVPTDGITSVPEHPKIDFNTPLDASTLKGKSVLITGGASGIGLASAKAIASHGAFVTIADVQQEAGEAAAKSLSSDGHKVQFVQCDVTSYDSQFAAFKSAIEFGGGSLDVVVPNAGVIHQKNLIDMAAATEPSLDNAPPEPGYSGMDINVKGVYYSCYLALHYFRLPPPANATPFKKTIVLLASMAGYLGYPHSTTYSMSKFAVRGILYGIREQALEAGVRVNLVAPWYIKTAMTTGDDEQMNAHLALFGFASIDNVVDAIVRFSADQQLATRAALIVPEGAFDIGDDIWGGYGGAVLPQRMNVIMGNLAKKMAGEESQKRKRELENVDGTEVAQEV